MDKSVIATVELDYPEALALEGTVMNVHLFSLFQCDVSSVVIEKGVQGATKHFEIPTPFRTKSKKKPLAFSCQSLNLETKVVFIYVVNKGF